VKNIFVRGIGAVSPAGWGIEPFRSALAEKKVFEPKPLARPGWEHPLQVRQVPAPPTRPAFLAHARLRRTSPITQFSVASGLEALGENAAAITSGNLRLGIIQCVMSGCINYSRRFYDETLRDPATASPLVFPETVFNAPASHIAALLGTNAINYTIVGDPGTFLQGVALAANWLFNDRVDGCLVIGAEETDWLTADAFRRFQRKMILSDGAGAIFLRTELGANLIQLAKITDAHPFLKNQNRHCAAMKMRRELTANFPTSLLCDSTQEMPRLDAAEIEAWKDWSGERVSPKNIFGEGLMAAAAWQCVAAIDALQQNHYKIANVSTVGCNQQAIGAEFISTISTK
jgi:3-oxoacyl-(acyl-carrier-protein) synthase